jgi:hypothetical protein
MLTLIDRRVLPYVLKLFLCYDDCGAMSAETGDCDGLLTKTTCKPPGSV